MAKNWGVARFYGGGSMEYQLESGRWLTDGKLFDGAPIRLYETMAEADQAAGQLPQDGQPHGVQFTLDAQGRVATARKTAPKTLKPRARG
ncbi:MULTISPECIES: hypothetical protein [unclassified Hydrogenophaga]|jgi:hypothetical protein|uniref:hypothetical protein n=1 Tax=unclassified Hydrogenophaga TaxID=2610897 RepID=UPI00131FB8CD|nr:MULTISPECIES: hypothetical protein [unclassified Hydrogenophaga]QHE78712.1 hypothetical protein F9Z45_21520 [Hydrogenophaga sp. PBL-H3]QHE83137.1 hypothetical protein F9Z44_21520 [Hydrogenophaga sp. PBL-H3]